MSRETLKTISLDPKHFSDPFMIGLLRLMRPLEVANVAYKWYVRRFSGEEALPDNESVVCIGIACASTAVAFVSPRRRNDRKMDSQDSRSTEMRRIVGENILLH